MPFPYTRRRSRNRNRPNALQPAFAAVASIVTAVHGTNKTTLTFDQQMNTALTAVPPGLLIDGAAPTAVTWTSATVAELTTATSTAGDTYVLPAGTTWRTAAGGAVAAASGVLT